MKKNIMTKEVREQLLGILPMSVDAVHKFTPKQFDDVPEEYKPVFEIKQYTNSDVIGIKSLIYRGLNEPQETGKTTNTKAKSIKKFTESSQDDLEFLKKSLVGWSNLINLDTGEQIVFDDTIEMLEMIPEVIRREIFKEAVRITGFIDSKDIQ